MRALVILILLVALPGGAAAENPACGLAGAPACTVALGRYSVRLPEGPGPHPALMHLHGAGGTGEAVADGAVARTALARGYAVIAPSGWHPERPRWRKNWSVRAAGTTHEFKHDDLVFLEQVIADAVARFPLDRGRLLLSGFSRGGSFAWDVACRRPGFARAYAPVAGAFWDPVPTAEDCGGPVDLLHTHGWTDRVVPLEGRSLRGGAVVQGDVFESLFTLRAVNGCTDRQPAAGPIEGDLWIREWSDCSAGRIDLILHPGGHGVPAWWADRALDWFGARLAEDARPGREDDRCAASC